MTAAAGAQRRPLASERTAAAGYPRRRERAHGGGDRARGARRARDRHEDVLQLRQRVRRRAQHAHLSRCASGSRARCRCSTQQAVELVLRFAEAVHLHVPPRSIFARKNYFYPDMPKDYQISQYEDPITVDGWLEIGDARGRHRTCAPRRGHRQDAAHRRRRSYPRSELLARRLQPRRRPAHGDREPARHPQRRAGARVRVGAARRARGRRRVRREVRRRLDAGRRQRVGSAARHARSSASRSKSRT